MGNFLLFKQKNRPNDIGTNGLMSVSRLQIFQFVNSGLQEEQENCRQTFFICAKVLLELKFTIKHLFRIELMIPTRCKNMHLNIMMHTMRQKHAVKTI